jgi:hypothetical protein
MSSHRVSPPVLLILLAGALIVPPSRAGASEEKLAVTAGRPALPAGVTSGWWSEVRDSLQEATTEQKERPSSVERALPFPNWTAESDQASALFGCSVAGAGDVNGDGYGDVIVGAHQYSAGQYFEGGAFAYYGSAAGLSTTADWTAEPNQAAAHFGASVAAAGDVNGDGYDDVIVGAFGYHNGQTEEGRAFAYYGSASGLNTAANWTAEPNQAVAYFGISVAGAGDVNGDSYNDVIVGASNYTNGQLGEGRAFAYYGSAAGLSATPNWTAESDQESAQFGISVAGAGDVNGDAFDDVIVGASGYNNGQSYEGGAFAYSGSAAGLSATADWTAESDQDIAYFGYSVSTAGDVNRDGFDDVIVGASDYDNGQVDEGRAFAYYGSAAGLSATADWTAESNQAAAHFGVSVAGAGDVNGDEFDDVIVGASRYDNGQVDEGRAFVFCGSAAALKTAPCRRGESNQAAAQFGVSVAGAGDVNGDNYDDRIVGAFFYDHGQTDEGVAFAKHGGPG